LNWVVSKGEDRYRRGLYTFNKRTAPYAMFSTFDAPSGESCLSRRDPSNTPLQALTMLNSEVLLEAAQQMALRSLRESPQDIRQQILGMFRESLIRPPSEQELNLLTQFYQRQRDLFSEDRLKAHLLTGAGVIKRWDFNDGNEGWSAVNQSSLSHLKNRIVIASTGNDPFLRTSLEAPAGQLTVKFRLHSEEQGPCQLFWTTANSPVESAQHSASIEVKPGWAEYQAVINADESLTGLRFDPVAKPGRTEVDWIEVSVGNNHQTLPADVNVVDWATLTLVARSLLNLDEAITKP
jgi:hypothetical protein